MVRWKISNESSRCTRLSLNIARAEFAHFFSQMCRPHLREQTPPASWAAWQKTTLSVWGGKKKTKKKSWFTDEPPHDKPPKHQLEQHWKNPVKLDSPFLGSLFNLTGFSLEIRKALRNVGPLRWESTALSVLSSIKKNASYYVVWIVSLSQVRILVILFIWTLSRIQIKSTKALCLQIYP